MDISKPFPRDIDCVCVMRSSGCREYNSIVDLLASKVTLFDNQVIGVRESEVIGSMPIVKVKLADQNHF